MKTAWNETNIHTLLTQLVAVTAMVFGLVHGGESGFSVPDSILTSASVLGAAAASGIHAIAKSKNNGIGG